jgi:hypothetical protein
MRSAWFACWTAASLTTSSKMLHRVVIGLFLFLSAAVFANDGKTEFGGHTKFRLTGQAYPDQSLFRDEVGSDSLARISSFLAYRMMTVAFST